jgi:serine/threonine protein kinase
MKLPESQSIGPGEVIAGYRIEELVSRGGMGVVYRATNVALGQRYAIKVLAPELAHDERFLERFRREIRLAASLRHPHAVAVHYADEIGGQPFLVMDFIAGPNLREVIVRDGPLEPGRAVRLLNQITGALDEAHHVGLVHRDIKPANVLVAERGGDEHSYLTDFGLAKRLETRSDLTRTGLALGTVDYMAPEQITGGHVDARTDVYALGCMFFQMLTGRVPFERDNTAATMWAQVYDQPPTLSTLRESVHPALDGVLIKAMAKDPDERYLSAGDLGRDAAAALAGGRYEGRPTVVATGEATPVSVTVPPESNAGELRSTAEAPSTDNVQDQAASGSDGRSGWTPRATAAAGRRRRRTLAAVLALALVAVVVVVALLMSSKSSPELNQSQVVNRIAQILDFSEKGRAAAHDGRFDAALSNRRETVRRVAALQGSTDVLAGTLQRLHTVATADVDAVVAYKACGGTGCAPEKTRATVRAKRAFLDGFNPLAARQLHRTFTIADL